MKVLILSFGLLFLASCFEKEKNCELIGKWESTEFNSDKAVDMNKDGIYNQDLLQEDDCSEVIFHFKKNGKAERYYKNKRTNCKFKKSTLDYIVNGNQILFTVSGMKQKHKYKITNCKLNIYGAQDSGLTENGKQNILINSVFEKK